MFKEWYHGKSSARVTFLRSRRFGMALFTLSRITGRYLSGFRRRQLTRHVVMWNTLDDRGRKAEACAAVLDARVRAAATADGVPLPGPKDPAVMALAADAAADAESPMQAFYEGMLANVGTRWRAFMEWYQASDRLQVRVDALPMCDAGPSATRVLTGLVWPLRCAGPAGVPSSRDHLRIGRRHRAAGGCRSPRGRATQGRAV